jgi:selenide,water dikinase
VDNRDSGSLGKSPVRLTDQVKAGGCASKLPPGLLHSVLTRLPPQHDPNVLVGFDRSDDAGVYRIAPDVAMVQTVDFFTPMVDDPYTYGQIAATNALSDVYAMGGLPVTALSLVCFPQDGDPDILEQIMLGGLSKMQEAGCAVVGGHSVRDPEMKFGYAVTGLIHPDAVLTNSGARPGDVLLLTKAIGTGVIATALRQQKAESSWVASAVLSMTTLNSSALELARKYEVHGATDITGFGLMGHCREMALGSGVRLSIEVSAIPLLEGANAAVRAGAIPAGLLANREFAECLVHKTEGTQIDPDLEALLYDPQTAGGLLLAVSASDAEPLLSELRASGLPAAQIGCVLAQANDAQTAQVIELTCGGAGSHAGHRVKG